MTRSSRARTGARGEDAVAPGQLSAQGWRELVRRAAKHVVRPRVHFLSARGCVLRRPVRRPSAGDRALGLPLDLGRTTRLYTKAQRIALGLRDGGCTARGCETTASSCHAHHDHPWSRHGLTDLANGRLLCPRHHRLAHDSRSVMTIHPDNQVTFTRRT